MVVGGCFVIQTTSPADFKSSDMIQADHDLEKQKVDPSSGYHHTGGINLVEPFWSEHREYRSKQLTKNSTHLVLFLLY